MKIAYYDQENANLDPENSVLDELWGRHVLWEQTKVRSILAQAGLPAEDVDKKVRMLSGGERAKLALAVFECENANVLLLDEPTNHLDLPARESLESALKEFEGSILFVSHDRYFIKALAGKILELENGQGRIFDGDYDGFTAYKNAAKENVQRNPVPIEQTEKNVYHRTKEDRAADAKRKNRIKKIEEEISSLEEEDALINASLSDPEVTSNFPLLTEKCNRLDEIKTLLDSLYQEYETLL